MIVTTQFRHPEQSQRHSVQFSRHPAQSPHHPAQSPRHPAQSPRHPEQSPRHPEQSPRHPEQSEGSHHIPLKEFIPSLPEMQNAKISSQKCHCVYPNDALQSHTRKSAFTLAEVLITLGIIGIVAAMTLPAIVGNYQKNVTVTRLKKVYSIIAQSLSLAKNDYDEIIYWDFELSSQEFMDRYLSPYFSSIIEMKMSTDARYSKKYVLPDGTTFYGWSFRASNPEDHDVTTFYKIVVDTNGTQKPNQHGRDLFNFYIFPQKLRIYNVGTGNCAVGVPSAGLYPDGYGFKRDVLLNDGWRGCNIKSTDKNPDGGVGNSAGAFCTALIMLDGWKIAPDYKW